MGVSLPPSPLPGDFRISPKYFASDWRSLNPGDPGNLDWHQAVAIFHDRMNGRFLAPIDAIRHHPDPAIAEFSGFTIVAIDCLLIETLGQFYKGIEQTPSRPLTKPSQHCQHFIDFFQKSPHFAGSFDAQKGELFYTHFRCKILHQAQTIKKSRVRYGEPVMVAFADPADPDQGLIVDRELLHQALVAEFDDYKARLNNPQSVDDHQKRANFLRKWSYIVP